MKTTETTKHTETVWPGNWVERADGCFVRETYAQQAAREARESESNATLPLPALDARKTAGCDCPDCVSARMEKRIMELEAALGRLALEATHLAATGTGFIHLEAAINHANAVTGHTAPLTWADAREGSIAFVARNGRAAKG